MTCEQLRTRLSPYVDSGLADDELAEFESHLRGCASCANEAVGLLQMKRMTRAAATRYSPSPDFRLRMEQQIRAKQKPAWSALWMPKLGMAAVAAVLLIAAVIFSVTHAARERTFAELADLHVTSLASANPVDVVSTDRHTVKPWFAGRIPFTFNLPELNGSEFSLAGGRVAYFHHNPGAQLLFNLRKHELSVFIFQERPGDVPLSPGTVDSAMLAFHIETWSQAGLRYFIVSDASASDVRALSELMKRAARS
jgi:anti-sigma factor RsiW